MKLHHSHLLDHPVVAHLGELGALLVLKPLDEVLDLTLEIEHPKLWDVPHFLRHYMHLSPRYKKADVVSAS